MLTEIKLFIRNAFTKVVDFYLKVPSLFPKRKTLLILRLDDIGDYVLYRNIIEFIKTSGKFSDYKIFFAGNEKWKDLAEKYDRDFVSGFFWVNVKKFKSKMNWSYRLKILLKLKSLRCEVLIIPNDTTSERIKYIAERTGIRNRIMKENDSVYLEREVEMYFRKNGHLSFQEYQKQFFQFYRNIEYAQKITGSISSLKKPYFSKEERIKANYGRIILFPGAGHDSRAWPAKNFGELCKRISDITDSEILICGDKSDKERANKIKSVFNNAIDITSKTTLPELIKLIDESDMLISNETCAVHIAACVNTKTVCLSNGNHLGRFNPYPEECADFIHTIYPDVILSNMKDYKTFVKEFIIMSDISMEKISVDKVFETVSSIIQGHSQKSIRHEAAGKTEFKNSGIAK